MTPNLQLCHVRVLWAGPAAFSFAFVFFSFGFVFKAEIQSATLSGNHHFRVQSRSDCDAAWYNDNGAAPQASPLRGSAAAWNSRGGLSGPRHPQGRHRSGPRHHRLLLLPSSRKVSSASSSSSTSSSTSATAFSSGSASCRETSSGARLRIDLVIVDDGGALHDARQGCRVEHRSALRAGGGVFIEIEKFRTAVLTLVLVAELGFRHGIGPLESAGMHAAGVFSR